MREWYFCQDRGKTVGPLDLEEVRRRVRDGELRLFDLLFKEGADQWCMALEFPELKADFAASPFAQVGPKPWVLLQRKSETGSDFVTTGPFSSEEIILRLKAGQVQYTDYAWREGFEQWRRLATLRDFNDQAPGSTQKNSAVEGIMATPAEELLRQVVEFRRPYSDEAPAPHETEGEDLTKAPPPLPVKKKKKFLAAVPEVINEESSESLLRGERRKKSRDRQAWWKDISLLEWGLGALIVGSLCFLVATGLGGGGEAAIDPISPPTPQANVESAPRPVALEERREEGPPLEPVPELQVDLSDSEGEPVPLPEPKQKNEGKGGKLSLKVEASQNKFNFVLRASGKDAVLVQIIGLPGQVLGRASFYKYLRLLPQEDGLVPVEASQLQLPAGRYLIRATQGEEEREQKFQLGTSDRKFTSELARTRKMYSSELWLDRLKLLRLVEQLEVYVAQRLQNPKVKVRQGTLGALAEVKRATGSKYLLFDDWYELREIFEDAKKDPRPELLSRVMSQRNRLANLALQR